MKTALAQGNNKKAIGISALLLAALIWGAEFAVMKDVLYSIGPNLMNTVKYILGEVLFTVVFFKRIIKATKNDIKGGIITGVFIGFGNAFQAMGLTTVSVTVNAFLSAIYVLLIPFIVWIIYKTAPTRRIFLCAFLAIAGTVLLSTGGDFSDVIFHRGEILTLVAACFYSFVIISIDRYAREIDPIILTILQSYVATVLSVVFTFALEGTPDYKINGILVIQFLFMAIFAVMLTQLLMNYGMRYVTATHAGIIFPTEGVFASVFAFVFLGEAVTGVMFLGSAFIAAGIIILEIGPAAQGNNRSAQIPK